MAGWYSFENKKQASEMSDPLSGAEFFVVQ